MEKIINSTSNKLKQVLETLKRNYDTTLDVSSLDAIESETLSVLESIKAESAFTDYHNSPRFVKSTLILEAVKLLRIATEENTISIIEGTKMKKRIVEGNEIEKAEVLLASKNIVDDLQGMIEDISKLQVEQIPPIVDRIKVDNGLADAAQYREQSLSLLQGVMDSLQTAKDGIDNLTMVLGGEVDMAQATGEPDMGDMGDMGTEPSVDSAMEPQMEVPPTAPAERQRKESRNNTKPVISEDVNVAAKTVYKLVKRDGMPFKDALNKVKSSMVGRGEDISAVSRQAKSLLGEAVSFARKPGYYLIDIHTHEPVQGPFATHALAVDARMNHEQDQDKVFVTHYDGKKAHQVSRVGEIHGNNLIAETNPEEKTWEITINEPAAGGRMGRDLRSSIRAKFRIGAMNFADAVAQAKRTYMQAKALPRWNDDLEVFAKVVSLPMNEDSTVGTVGTIPTSGPQTKVAAPATGKVAAMKAGDPISTKTMGNGKVVSNTGSAVTVRFDNGKTKTFGGGQPIPENAEMSIKDAKTIIASHYNVKELQNIIRDIQSSPASLRGTEDNKRLQAAKLILRSKTNPKESIEEDVVDFPKEESRNELLKDIIRELKAIFSDQDNIDLNHVARHIEDKFGKRLATLDIDMPEFMHEVESFMKNKMGKTVQFESKQGHDHYTGEQFKVGDRVLRIDSDDQNDTGVVVGYSKMNKGWVMFKSSYGIITPVDPDALEKINESKDMPSKAKLVATKNKNADRAKVALKKSNVKESTEAVQISPSPVKAIVQYGWDKSTTKQFDNVRDAEKWLKTMVDKAKPGTVIDTRIVKAKTKVSEGEYDVHQYIVKVKHDKGTSKIKTSATSPAAAKKIVMKNEGCPATAILSVTLKESVATTIKMIVETTSGKKGQKTFINEVEAKKWVKLNGHNLKTVKLVK